MPLLVLLAALQFFLRKTGLSCYSVRYFISGILTWLIGRSSYHIGASGLVYVLVSLYFVKGILTDTIGCIIASRDNAVRRNSLVCVSKSR
jgi:membrane associated rhomboid family serine protease